MQLSFGFSPCPNDTFMFEAIVNHRIDLESIDFIIQLADVELLNKWALESKLDITKLSFATFMKVKDAYQLLNSGSALGHNCGPLLIAKKDFKKSINESVIGIPGKNTTANLLLDFAYHDIKNKKELIFSDIEKAILEDQIDAGVIIHESRFTFQKKGLIKIMDLGENWESKTHSPIPLGGIAVKRSLPEEIKQSIQSIVEASVLFAFKYPELSNDYVSCHAQEMDVDVMKAHIQLYVNEYSKNLGQKGRQAIKILANHYFQKEISSIELNKLFV